MKGLENAIHEAFEMHPDMMGGLLEVYNLGRSDERGVLSRAAAPAETEWEYSVGFEDAEVGWTNDLADIHDDQEDAEEDFRNPSGSWLDGDQIVRRRKAGPWLPVPGGEDEC